MAGYGVINTTPVNVRKGSIPDCARAVLFMVGESERENEEGTRQSEVFSMVYCFGRRAVRERE